MTKVIQIKIIKDFEKTLNEYGKESKQHIQYLIGLFATGLIIMIYLFMTSPNLKDEEKEKLYVFPRTPDELRGIVEVVNSYTKSHYYYVLSFFICFYLL